jgi:acetylornithine/succinyldiaminopimelate/putrescine aminotransferase
VKKCSKCKKEKELSDYFWRDKSKNKLHSQCKDCYKACRHSQEHYKKYKEQYIKRSKARQKRIGTENKKHLIEYFKNHPCIECGESNPVVLEFDHRDRKQKWKEVSTMLRDYTWEQILKEIDKCDVLCANHHKIRTSKQMGWWYESI